MSKPLTSLQIDAHKRLLLVSRDLVGCLSQDHPSEPVVGLMVMSLFEAALAYAPETVSVAIADFITQHVRTRAGFCTMCDNSIGAHMSHPPICERCDAKMAGQSERMIGDMLKELDL